MWKWLLASTFKPAIKILVRNNAETLHPKIQLKSLSRRSNHMTSRQVTSWRLTVWVYLRTTVIENRILAQQCKKCSHILRHTIQNIINSVVGHNNIHKHNKRMYFVTHNRSDKRGIKLCAREEVDSQTEPTFVGSPFYYLILFHHTAIVPVFT